MANTYFQFKEFRIEQAQSGMKVTTDACLFGAWVANDIKRIGERPKRILDVGTGTGLLSLMVAQGTQGNQISALEVSEDAFKEASFNFKNSPWSNQMKCFHRSLQDYSSEPYDVIICNPPFFKGSPQGKSVNKNQAVHSTLLPAEELLENAIRLLANEGVFYLLYPEREMNSFIHLAQENGLNLQQQTIVTNQEGQSTFRIMAAFGKKKGSNARSGIAIRKSDGKYTQKFWALLKDYYLEYNDPMFGANKVEVV